MKSVTRARPRVDRVACPWLIRRFVDPTAEFLGKLALIVRGADTEAKDLGLEAVAEGFRLIYRDDHELLERELPVYDALYAYERAAP